MNQDEVHETSVPKKLFRSSKVAAKRSGEVAGKVLNKGVELSATGIDKSTGASKYQTDAIAVNGRLERALQIIEETLTNQREENAQLHQQVNDLRTEVASLRELLNKNHAIMQGSATETPLTFPPTPAKRKWWKRREA